MRKHFNGKRYDTNSAIFLGWCEIFGNFDPAKRMAFKMYVTPRSKSFFLCGVGGVLTVFKGKTGESIVPIDRELAYSIAVENLMLDQDVLDRWFN